MIGRGVACPALMKAPWADPSVKAGQDRVRIIWRRRWRNTSYRWPSGLPPFVNSWLSSFLPLTDLSHTFFPVNLSRLSLHAFHHAPFIYDSCNGRIHRTFIA